MYMKAFLLTYRSFATPEQLLCKLIERYHVPAREEQNRTKIQLRVCNTVKVRHTQGERICRQRQDERFLTLAPRHSIGSRIARRTSTTISHNRSWTLSMIH